MDAGVYDCACTNPNVIADGDGFSVFEATDAGGGVGRVGGAQDANSGGAEAVFADADFADVENDEIEVGVEVFSEMNVGAVVAAKVGLDVGAVGDAAEELFECGESVCGGGLGECVVGGAERFGVGSRLE